MRLLHFLEIENFKRFKSKQRIELDHPTVIIGPNNCGKTTAIQAIALWAQAIKTWHEKKGKSKPKRRPSTALNRLNIVSVPVRRTKYFWHNTAVRKGNRDIHLSITVGVQHKNKVAPVTMQFRNQGDELVYCTPDKKTLNNPGLIAAAAGLKIELLYPMSGLETEEPVLRPGRIDVLLGQGQTAQVLRNLCLIVSRDYQDEWSRIKQLMQRLFMIEFEDPTVDESRGSIDLFYRQGGVKERLDIAMAGRGLQQMLLLFAYLCAHPRSVLLVDEPDAHLEILRQKQVYVLLRELAAQNKSQVILVTHSEVILGEAVDHNLTLLLSGKTDNLARKGAINNALKHYGAEHYVRARQRGYVLYVEGRTDIDLLKALARRLGHPVHAIWDEQINTFYVQDNYPDPKGLNTQLDRVEGGFGITPKEHFHGLSNIIPQLEGLAILDGDNQGRRDFDEGKLKVVYWKRYEIENYFITQDLLEEYTMKHYGAMELFYSKEVSRIRDKLIYERIFEGDKKSFLTWKKASPDVAALLWQAKAERIKLSDYAEEYFKELGEALQHTALLTKGTLHELVPLVDSAEIHGEIGEKLDLLRHLFENANSMSEA